MYTVSPFVKKVKSRNYTWREIIQANTFEESRGIIDIYGLPPFQFNAHGLFIFSLLFVFKSKKGLSEGGKK